MKASPNYIILGGAQGIFLLRCGIFTKMEIVRVMTLISRGRPSCFIAEGAPKAEKQLASWVTSIGWGCRG